MENHYPCHPYIAIPSSPSPYPVWLDVWHTNGVDSLYTYRVQAATHLPVLSPSLKCSLLDHLLLHSAPQLCSPTVALTPKSLKRPKMQMPQDSFPTDWSPPPIEFLNKSKKAPPTRRRPLEDLEKDPPDPDQKVELASLEELFWNMAGPSQQAGTPEVSKAVAILASPHWPLLLVTFSCPQATF